MPAASVDNSEILLTSGIWGSTQLGIVVGYAWRYVLGRVTIRGEGSVNPDQQGLIAKQLVCTVQFLVAPPVADNATPATLTFVTNKTASGTVNDALSNMIPNGASKQVNRDSPPFIYEQEFICKGTCSMPAQS
jgi:hypothetical protein